MTKRRPISVRPRRFFRALLTVATASVLLACTTDTGSPGSGTGGWAENPALVYAGRSLTHIDPAQATDTDSFTVSRNLYDPLVWNDLDGKIVPWLATSWETSSDGRETTFKLREGVKFTDGSPFTSRDVKVTIERMIDLKGGQSTLLLSGVTGATTPDDNTVVIHTATPQPFLLEHLTRIGIISAKAVDDHKTDSDPWAARWYDSNSLGTGPYTLDNWVKNVSVTLKKNRDWWHGWEAGSIDTVLIKLISDNNTAIQLFNNGEVDLAQRWAVTDAEKAGERPGVHLQTYKTYDIEPVIVLNTQKPPFDNVLVRRAAQLAFDYNAMRAYWGGRAITPGGPLPNGFPGAVDYPSFTQDLAKAKSLIAQSGVDVSKTPVTISQLQGTASYGAAVQIFQQSLEAIGLKVTIQVLPGAQIYATLGKPDAGANAATLISSPYTWDPTLFLANFYLPGGAFNLAYYDNPKVTALFEQARAASSKEQALQFTGDAEAIIRDDAPAIWISVPETLVPVPDYITGYDISTTDFRWATYFWPIRMKAH